MTENNMLPATLLEEIHSLKESMDRIASFILELKQDYAVLEEKIELNSSDVLRQFFRCPAASRHIQSFTGAMERQQGCPLSLCFLQSCGLSLQRTVHCNQDGACFLQRLS